MDFNVRGKLKLDVFKHGILIDSFEDDNLIVLSGKQLTTFLIAGEPGNHRITKVGVGENASSPYFSDTTLTNGYIKNVDGYTFLEPTVVQWNFTIGIGEANGLTIAEYALFSTDEQMFARKTRIPAIPKDNSISFAGDWSIFLVECKKTIFFVLPTIQTSIITDIDQNFDNNFASSAAIFSAMISDIDPGAASPEEHVYIQYSELGDGRVSNLDTGWATTRDGAVGTEAQPSSTNEQGAIESRDFGGGDFVVSRSHFEFDLSEIDATGRTFTDISLDLTGYGYDESTVQVQESTFSGTVVLADFDEFTGAMFLDTPFTWELWDGGDPARNVMSLNTAGEAFITGKLGTSSAKLCAREAVYDVGNVTPTGNHRCGTFYRDIEWTGAPLYQSPRLILTYDKLPDWAAHFDNTQWSIDTGSWDGTKYTTSGDALILNTPTFATGYKPYKLRVDFTTATSIWVQLWNTEGSKKIIDDQMFSGVPYIINNYNNWDLDVLEIFNYNSGDFDVTNIEFLNP